MAAITVDNLVKTYTVAERRAGTWGALTSLVHRTHRQVHALADVSFSIGPGELVGYIGPNGAGKSTTVKILSGILVPSSGSVTVLGRVPWRERIAHVAQIGVVFGQRTQLWWTSRSQIPLTSCVRSTGCRPISTAARALNWLTS